MKKEKNDVSEKDNNSQENNEVNSSEEDLEIKENNNEDSTKNEKISPEEEITKLNDMLLRSVAELDNYKKRTAKEIQQAQLYSTEKLSSELLVIMDSLEAAEKISGEPNLKVESLVEGNNLLLKTTQEIFDKLNIEEINPINESFNPDFHQALATKESESLENTVIEVMQKGYKLKSKLLRPALVIVSKKSQ
jgi:molecular chaperone GrpE|tara:strand:+ start:12954 stop:13529 length:576 start_codon:yes stop_codon:yes gene_type:complete